MYLFFFSFFLLRSNRRARNHVRPSPDAHCTEASLTTPRGTPLGRPSLVTPALPRSRGSRSIPISPEEAKSTAAKTCSQTSLQVPGEEKKIQSLLQQQQSLGGLWFCYVTIYDFLTPIKKFSPFAMEVFVTQFMMRDDDYDDDDDFLTSHFFEVIIYLRKLQ